MKNKDFSCLEVIFQFSQHLIFVNGHVLVQRHLSANYSGTVGTGVTEAVGEMAALDVLPHV